MSLFEYAQEVVSRKLERKEPMLTISMGMQPVMPMAQGGGLSSVQNSLNINGQPHRLAYINPNEEDLLKSLGGSGRKIDGIPAYMMGGPDGDHGYGEGFGGVGDPDSSDNTSPGFGTPGDPSFGTPDNPSFDEPAQNPDTFDIDSFPDISPSPDQNLNPYFPPPDLWDKRGELNRSPNKTVSINPFSAFISALTNPFVGGIVDWGMDKVGINANIDMSIPGTGTKGGYGDTGTGNQGGGGQDGTDGNDDDGTDAGGDDAADYIIKEKIAEVKQIPVKEVTVEEVQRAKRLTAAQRVAGTRLEDILDDIYGSGQGSELLSLAQSGGGIASLQKNININGQPHQLSYINPSEENLLKQLGGSGEKINGIPTYMMGGADGDHGYGDAPSGDDSTSTDDAAAGASASGGGDQAGGDDAPPEPEPVVAPKAPEVIIPKVEEPELPKQPRIVNTNLADILQTTYPNLSKSAIASMLGGLAAKEEKDSEEDFETDEEIINLLKKEGNPFPTPEDIQKYKSELNMKSILTQVYGNSNVLNNTGTA